MALFRFMTHLFSRVLPAVAVCAVLAACAAPAHAILLEPDQIIQAPQRPPGSTDPDYARARRDFDTSGFPVDVDVKVITYDMRWECELWKNDGAREDGFHGEGGSEVQARTEAAHACSRTNHPHCYSMAMDPEHTACSKIPRKNQRTVSYAADALPPGTRYRGWECELWKNDGARNDGFTGTGMTRDRALDASIASCERTDNDHCLEYALDPEHTTCMPLLVLEKPPAAE